MKKRIFPEPCEAIKCKFKRKNKTRLVREITTTLVENMEEIRKDDLTQLTLLLDRTNALKN